MNFPQFFSFFVVMLLKLETQGLLRHFPQPRKFRLHTSSSKVDLDTLVNLAKKKGFVYQSSEIYGPLAGFYDFGPLGVELKNNIKRLWWKSMVQNREDMFGLDSSIISSSKIWEASGHVDGFSDPMVDCKETKLRFRADHIYWAPVASENGENIFYITVQECVDIVSAADKTAKRIAMDRGFKGKVFVGELKVLTEAPAEVYHLLPSPITGHPGTLTIPRDFNLMFETSIGAVKDAANIAYLRPETAQGIFTNFLAVQRSMRAKIPFGIAQIGKAFRNELTPKNFVFRSREFEQMEIEYFISPDESKWKEIHAKWIEIYLNWLKAIGVDPHLLSLEEHAPSKLAHYAKACTDILFKFPFGQQELMGIAARGNFDLLRHSQHSGKALEYLDSQDQTKFIPHVIEPSIGVDRLFLALLTSAYREEVVNNEKRVVLSFHPAIAPIQISVFPLVSNNAELVQRARSISKRLKTEFTTDFDVSGGIGKRYRRADEAGVPFCITVDFDSLSDDSVTVRERDSMQQHRLKITELPSFFHDQIRDPIVFCE